MKTIKLWSPAIFFSIIKLISHLFTAQNLGFHRDEFLYLALGRHLDWGYWSNGPFIGFVSWIGRHTVGDTLLATRFWPALAGALLVFATLRMTALLGGGRYAQVLCGIALLFSPAMQRSASMLQPVIFDVLFWTLAGWMALGYLRSENNKWLYGLGLAIGFGLLNKYSVVFLAICLPLAILLTPQRRFLWKKEVLTAVLLAAVVVAPNMYWQWQHGFPVVNHMRELAESQLSAVNPVNFLLDQLLINGLAFVIWLPGLWFLFSRAGKPYRTLGWFAVLTVALLLVMRGKSYYTLGVYPVLIAAGGVFWEKLLSKLWTRTTLPLLITLCSLPLLPVGIPLMSAPRLVDYFNNLGLESALRWERGNVEALPQDYADMLGWEQLAALVDTAVGRVDKREALVIYAENYGQAGAVEHLSRACRENGLTVVSFADSYRLWAPRRLDAGKNTLIYINDELGEDVRNLFDQIELVGTLNDPLARERGTQVYLCRRPRQSFAEFWATRTAQL